MNKKTGKIKRPSKGELFIENYLIDSNIEHITQYKIDDLKEDKFSYRVADFYLPKLGFFVEYYGMYNKSDKHKSEYEYKSSLYIRNKKPTIFLYPEDLGILDFSFHSEVKRLFKYKIYHNKWNYFRYSLNRYLTGGKPYFILIILYFYTLGVTLNGFDLGINQAFRNILAYSCFIISLIYVWKFSKDIMKYFHLKEILGFIELNDFNTK